MRAFETQRINPTFNSIPTEMISLFDKNSAYIQGTTRIYNDTIYEALTDITPTVQFVWNSTDVNNKFGYDLYNNITIPDPTNVYCTSDTIVWSIRNKKYYQAKTDGFINFVSQDPMAPADFNDLGATPTPLYRISLNFPDGKNNTLYWEYKGATNRSVMFDGTLNKRSVNKRSFSTSLDVNISMSGTVTLLEALSADIYEGDKIKISGSTLNTDIYQISTIAVDRLSFTTSSLMNTETITGVITTFYTQSYIKWVNFGIDRVAIFNTECEGLELKVTVANGIPTTYSDSMSDSSFITTFETFCFNEPARKTRSIFTLPMDFNQEFELTFFGDYQEIGEVVQGQSQYLGRVEDSMSMDGKVYEGIIESPNGDVYLEEDSTQFNVVKRKSFTLVIPSNTVCSQERLLKTLQNKRLVVSGTDEDNDNNSLLFFYGFIRDYTFNPLVKHDLSTYKFEAREFL